MICLLCKREIFPGFGSKHHLVPESRGGKETIPLHGICHSKIHHVFTEKELEKSYNTIEKLLEHEEIQRFVKWISKQPLNFIDKNKDTKIRKEQRKFVKG